MYARFRDVHSKWLERADSEQVDQCQRWLDGVAASGDRTLQSACEATDESSGACVDGDKRVTSDKGSEQSSIRSPEAAASLDRRTKRVTLQQHDRPPYRTFCRYVVEKETGSS